ncbi:MAG TPA: Ig-like domain-containing protein [Ignavibacteriales bacterium]|nr:Ig-like domain-containing protein [Ignavibacteriales bacterium]
MARQTGRQIVRLLFIPALVLLQMAGCANQLPPAGGPIDRTPPEIVDAYPKNGTTDFKDDHFEVTFSKYVDRRSVQDAIFISPAIEGEMEYDWSGKTLRVNFPGKLKDSVTYVVTFGTDLVDINNRNRMAQAYSFSFSTGSRIDKGVVEGKVYLSDPSGVMIYAYPIKDTSKVNPTKEKPEYISQAGKDGSYRMPGMAPGQYRIFAVKDELKDFIYNVGEDLYGAPYRDISISQKDSLFKNLDYFLAKEDTAKPRLVSAAMTDRFHVLTAVSEEFDSTIISSQNFFLYDSTLQREVKPLYAFRGRAKATEVILSFKENPGEQDNVYLVAKRITDKNGNSTNNDFVKLTVSTKPDTTAPKLLQTKPPRGESGVETRGAEFYFYFDDGFDSTRAKTGISAIDKAGLKLPVEVSFLDDASFKVKIPVELKARQNYSIKVDLRMIADAAGNRTDSVFTLPFTTSAGMDFTGVSGSVKTDTNMTKSNLVVVLQGVDKEKPVYKKRIGRKKDFNFNKVTPGKYQVWSFEDRDSTGVYNMGKPYPFKPSDRFTFYPDTLNLRARWPVEDVIVEYK